MCERARPCQLYLVHLRLIVSPLLTAERVRSGMPILSQVAFTSSEGQGPAQFCGSLPDNAYSISLASSVNTWEPFVGTLPSCELPQLWLLAD